MALKTASIPHPYPAGGGAAFIERVRDEAGPCNRNLAITLRSNGSLIGMVGFSGSPGEVELAYMVAPEQWGRG